MKILIVDRLLKDKPHSDWKEGWEFYYAFQNLGHAVDIAGPDCPIPDISIPDIYKMYDFILITENYWNHPIPTPWKFWQWDQIPIFKIFWAVDSHLINYEGWVKKAKIDVVACNNYKDMVRFSVPTFWLPYGVSKKHLGIQITQEKLYDVSFIGSMISEERSRIINKFKVHHVTAFGSAYLEEMQKSRICLNIPLSYDFNAKFMEIMASGSLLLSKNNGSFKQLINLQGFEDLLWQNDQELQEKIDYFLSHSQDREDFAHTCKTYVLENHSWENRAQTILEFLGTFRHPLQGSCSYT